MARGKGEGSIYQIADGRWRASIEAGYTRTGTRRRIVITRDTKTAVQVEMKARLRQIAESGIPAPGSSGATVKAYADDWLARRVASKRPKTMERDTGVITGWVVPTIGHKRLGSLTPADVRAVHRAILKAGRSPASAVRAHTAMKKMLRDAIVDGYPVPPRVLLVAPPPSAITDRTGPTAAQALALLTTAENDPDLSRWAAALLQGMRQGECLGLTWGAVDLDRGIIDVSWQLQALPYEHGCGGTCGRGRAGNCPQRRFRIPIGYEVRRMRGQMCLVRPKTARGQRLIPLVPWMANALKRHGDEMGMDTDTLVWPGADGNPRQRRDDLAAWHDLQARADVAHPSGRPFHVHEARHATATLLMEAGVPESVRIAILGHSQAAVTRAYEHVDPAQARAALEQVAGRIGIG
ncbi:MAG: hypothetical protein BGO26_10075 [Actinobacteria bacterium 69-20]|nr:tyrosine-type recombinase/integrase [Actinomycetota bacterium]OJV23245.1 MAG: hypothetical protein BGO26_10075 [Actinobacteria bacterium 69-20]